MRRFIGGLALAAAAALTAPAPATAQLRVYFHDGGDSATGAVPATDVLVPVRAYNPFSAAYYYYGILSARITVVFDPSKLSVTGVDAACCGSLYYNIQTSSTPGTFTVRADGGAYGADVSLFRLRMRLAAGVTDGAYFWVRVDSLTVNAYGNRANEAMGAIGQVCHATDVFGDVDDNQTVDSRDALIALSAAVGLPVSGFSLGRGDVDRDSLTNSRDALMMLNYAIGLPTPWAGINRTGQGVPDACPGLTPAPETVVFSRTMGSGNDTLYTLAAAATAGVAVPNATGDLGSPRLAADDSSIVFRCTVGGYPHICRINADGTGLTDLTPTPVYFTNEWPDWSPDGSRVAYRNTYGQCYVFAMDANGANQTLLAPAYCGGMSVAWSRTGTQLAYATNGNGLRIVNSDGTGDALLTTGLSSQRLVRWSPAGDSLAMTNGSLPGFWVVPAAGGTAARIASFRTMSAVTGTDLGFDWGPAGFVFASHDPGREGLWLLPSATAPLVRLTRGRDDQPAFRRNP